MTSVHRFSGDSKSTWALRSTLRDIANLATAATFACDIGLAALAFTPAAADGHAAQSAACALAAAEPTDFNIEQCTGEPIDLAPGRADW